MKILQPGEVDPTPAEKDMVKKFYDEYFQEGVIQERIAKVILGRKATAEEESDGEEQ